MNPQLHPLHRPARGVSLLVALVFLLLFAVIAAAAFRGSLSSVQAIGNMQWRSEAIDGANDAIDKLLSETKFADNPAALAAEINATPLSLDVNGDGVSDVSVRFAEVTTSSGDKVRRPRCLRVEPIPNKNLDPTDPQDQPCYATSAAGNSGLGVVNGGGTSTIAQGLANCSNSEWSLAVEATDAVTNTNVTVVQGVGVRVLTTSVETCD